MGTSEHGEQQRLAGRATELTQLERIFRDLRENQDGRGRLVILSGPVGIGKTALARALLARIVEADPRAVALTADCVEDQTRFRPYGPFRDFLAQLSGVAGDAGLASVVRKEVPGWLPGAAPSAGRNALFDQFLALCRSIARQRPLVLHIDDVQWSDRSSLDLLARLGTALSSLPVLALVTYKQTAAENAISIKGLQHRIGPNAVELNVRELESAPVLELAEDLLDGSFASEFGDWLVGAAQGNALRAEQYLRWLLEQKTLRKRLFRYSIRESELPSHSARTEELVLGRLDGLEPNVRWTLEAATLAGGVVDSAVVAGQLGKRADEVLAQLRTVEAPHGLIEEISERRWASGARSVRFRFRHPLIRGLVRERVSGKRREHLLTRAAETLERLAGEGARELADEIAALYVPANQRPRLHEWSLKAADLAERLYALYETDEFLRIAAQTTEVELDRVRIEYRLASIYGATGRETEAEALLESVYKRARELGDNATEVGAGTTLGWLKFERGVPPLQMAELAGQLVDKARSAERPRELVMGLDLACVVAERVGRAEEALLMAEEALYVAEQSGDPEMVAQAAYRLARVHVSWGSPEEGRSLAQRALDVFSQVDELTGVAVCHDLLGLANFRAGEWDGALHHWELALESMEAAGVPDQKIAMQVNIAELLTLRGDFDRALRLFRSGLQLAEELDDPSLARRCRTGMARLEFERGDYAAVLEQTDEIRQVLPESGAWRDDFQTTAIRALAHLELGDEVQAWHEAARLEQLYQGKEGWFERRAEGDAVRIRVIDLDSDAWLAGMVAQQGIGETVDKDLYGEGFLRYHQAHVLAREKPAEAREAAERAVELFAKVGAAPMLTRAQQWLDELPVVAPETEETSGGEIDEDKLDKWFDSLEG
jgi:tetratricopeptide (TPR) repeat protein